MIISQCNMKAFNLGALTEKLHQIPKNNTGKVKTIEIEITLPRTAKF